jgi:hypothetical protein
VWVERRRALCHIGGIGREREREERERELSVSIPLRPI